MNNLGAGMKSDASMAMAVALTVSQPTQVEVSITKRAASALEISNTKAETPTFVARVNMQSGSTVKFEVVGGEVGLPSSSVEKQLQGVQGPNMLPMALARAVAKTNLGDDGFRSSSYQSPYGHGQSPDVYASDSQTTLEIGLGRDEEITLPTFREGQEQPLTACWAAMPDSPQK